MKKTIITVSLIVAVALIAGIGINILKPDDSNGDNLDDLFNSTTIDNISTLQPQENTSKENTQTDEQEMSPEDFVAAIKNNPTYAISWNVEDIIEYNGGEITIEVTVTNGSFKMEKGVSVSLNGVLQDCVIEYNSTKTEKSTMPTVVFAAEQVLTFKLTFTPNIGNKGDELEMVLVYSYLPNYRITDDSELKVITGIENSISTSGNIILRLNTDSSNSDNIAKNFSDIKISEINPVLYSSHYYQNFEGDIFNDTYEYNRSTLYHDFDKVYTVTEAEPFDHVEQLCSMTLPKATKTPLTINLYGNPGKRRVSLFINNEIQNVFNGKGYADIEIKDGEQAELFVEINTSELDKYNCIYVLSYELNEEFDPMAFNMAQLHPYVLITE